MILLSPNGDNVQELNSVSDSLLVGTIDGAYKLQRDDTGDWSIQSRGLDGCFVSALTCLGDGSIIAAMHGHGLARSRDGGVTWDFVVDGLTQFDVWTVRAVVIKGRELVFAGTSPAHLFVSDNGGNSWREVTALKKVPSYRRWTFPPPPHLGHVKDISVTNDRLFVGIEIGALLVSDDAGDNLVELPVDQDPTQIDIHRVICNAGQLDRIFASTGLCGMMFSEDNGKSWRKAPKIENLHYPDPLLSHPRDRNLLFVTGAFGPPPLWDETGKAQGRIMRSMDGGVNWQRLLGGLPNGQRALFCALSLAAKQDQTLLYAGDTDGHLFESRDSGDHWQIIAETAPVSKGDFFRTLARRPAPPLQPLPEKRLKKDDLGLHEFAGNTG